MKSRIHFFTQPSQNQRNLCGCNLCILRGLLCSKLESTQSNSSTLKLIYGFSDLRASKIVDPDEIGWDSLSCLSGLKHSNIFKSSCMLHYIQPLIAIIVYRLYRIDSGMLNANSWRPQWELLPNTEPSSSHMNYNMWNHRMTNYNQNHNLLLTLFIHFTKQMVVTCPFHTYRIAQGFSEQINEWFQIWFLIGNSNVIVWPPRFKI